MLHLGNISDDILIHIASYLDFDDLRRLRQVCVRVRTVASSTPVWRVASSRLRLPIRSSASVTDSSSHPTGLPDTLIRDTWRAAKIDRRWSIASPYDGFDHELAGNETWVDVKLVGNGQWMLCTSDRGDVAPMRVAQAVKPEPSTYSMKDRTLYRHSFLEWSGLVGWFGGLAVLSVQLESNSRSLNIRCYALASGDSPALDSARPQLPQYKLNLASQITVSAIEVCVSRRCLMLLCKDPNHSPPYFLDVWRWGPDEEHTRHPPQHAMRTAHFEANDYAFRLIKTKEGPHVLVVRANKDATHFEFYDLLEPMTNSGQIEPEPQIPLACESLPWVSHQITLPQPDDTSTTAPGYDSPVSVVVCAARSPRLSELLGYRVSLDRDRRVVLLSFVGGHMLPEYGDVLRCVLGERGVRGAAIISDPRMSSNSGLVLLTMSDDSLQLRNLEYPKLKALLPAALSISETHGTLAILGDTRSMHILIFDSYLFPDDNVNPNAIIA